MDDFVEYETEDYENLKIKKIEKEIDENDLIYSYSENLFEKLKFYCDFHGLNFLTESKNTCIYNLSSLE